MEMKVSPNNSRRRLALATLSYCRGSGDAGGVGDIFLLAMVLLVISSSSSSPLSSSSSFIILYHHLLYHHHRHHHQYQNNLTSQHLRFENPNNTSMGPKSSLSTPPRPASTAHQSLKNNPSIAGPGRQRRSMEGWASIVSTASIQ